MDGGGEKVAAPCGYHPILFEPDGLLFAVVKLQGKEAFPVAVLVFLAQDRIVTRTTVLKVRVVHPILGNEFELILDGSLIGQEKKSAIPIIRNDTGIKGISEW